MDTTWIENTTSKHSHGGPGWEFGTCIWSPSVKRTGVEGHYRVMRQVRTEDCVIHCCDGSIVGISRVACECFTTQDKPPIPGPWNYTGTYLRFNLENYRPIPKPITLKSLAETFKEEICRDIETNRPKYYLFSLYRPSEYWPTGRIVPAQGRFLAKSTPVLTRFVVQLTNLDPATFNL